MENRLDRQLVGRGVCKQALKEAGGRLSAKNRMDDDGIVGKAGNDLGVIMLLDGPEISLNVVDADTPTSAPPYPSFRDLAKRQAALVPRNDGRESAHIPAVRPRRCHIHHPLTGNSRQAPFEPFPPPPRLTV